MHPSTRIITSRTMFAFITTHISSTVIGISYTRFVFYGTKLAGVYHLERSCLIDSVIANKTEI